ncbi:SOS response-associated peptidase [Arthrobacter sp. efr-133-TYG-120]|uniref:SOS response-associated peptidase n=1 Tax=Arthrobacter sp. efr-133-TYG-120 TaxID=3040280 RepID=UPI00254D887D|nr:SOS response-associated peptidase [Arthrobacter sp. efr-133-TYG-120]
MVSKSTADLMAAFNINESYVDELPPSYNVGPTDTVPLILDRSSGEGAPVTRKLVTARWGLVPSWAKDPKGGARLINARMETVTEKPSFRKAASARRGLLVGDGYYEWDKTPGGGKIPTYLHGADDQILGFAALFEKWPDPSLPSNHPDKWLRTATIITTAAPDALGHIHDRTPPIVPQAMYTDWLDAATTSEADVRALLDSMPEPLLVPRVVSDRVNSVRNNRPELIQPAA